MLKVKLVAPGMARIEGRFDASQVDAAERALAELGGPARLDLSGLTVLSSAGISSLLRHYKSLKARGGDLVLVAPPAHVFDVLRYAGLDRLFTIEPGSSSTAHDE